MHVDAADGQARQIAGVSVDVAGARDRHAELVLRLAGRNLGVGAGVDVGIDADCDRRDRAAARRRARQPLQFRLRFDVEAQDVLLEPEAHLGQRLADAGKDDALARHARRPRPPQLPLADDVHACAESRQRRQHRLVRIGLHRIEEQRVLAGERASERLEIPLDRGARIAIEGRSDVIGDRRQSDVLGVKRAVAVGKRMHSLTANLVMPAHAGIQDRERRAVERRLSGREPWIPAFAGTTHCRMALGWMDRDETRVGSCDAFVLTAQTAYFSRKSRKKGCFGGMIGGIDGLASGAQISRVRVGGLGRRIGLGRRLERSVSAASREHKREQYGERRRARASGEEKRQCSGHERLRVVAGTIQKERAEARVEARPLQGNRAKAISSPLVGEDEGGGSHWTSKALFRPLLGDGRATPHPCPPPQGGAGARRTVTRFTSPECPDKPLGMLDPFHFERRESRFSRRDRPRWRLASGGAIRGPARPDA